MAKQKMPRTAKEIVAQTNEYARLLHKANGYYEAKKGYRFDKSFHPQAIHLWNTACGAMKFFCDLDAQAAADECD